MLRPRPGARIHLGCGAVHLPGYLNVDLPSRDGGGAPPDLEADVRELRCRPDCLAEIRLHHVFEHFDRVEALALLLRWHEWLRAGGLLTIETPDFDACASLYLQADARQRAAILRHVFGSHEASWAVHRDGWSGERLRHVLSELGFEPISALPGASDEAGMLQNITVQARKPANGPSRSERLAAARGLLELSMNGRAPSELELLAIWLRRLDELLEPGP